MAKRSIRDLELKGKTVFIRVDFNVPLAPGGQEITSDKRIRASLPTIQYALDQGAGVILASHLGRPKGKPNPEMSLKPAAERLAELLGAPGCDGSRLRGAGSGKDAAGGGRRFCCLRICGFTPRKKRTIRDSRNSWLRCATCM